MQGHICLLPLSVPLDGVPSQSAPSDPPSQGRISADRRVLLFGQLVELSGSSGDGRDQL